MILEGSRIVRQGQADDAFQVELGKHDISTGKFKADGQLGNNIVSIETIKENFDTVQRKLREQSNMTGSITAANTGDMNGGGGLVQRIVGGVATTVRDDAAMVPTPARLRGAAGGVAAARRPRGSVDNLSRRTPVKRDREGDDDGFACDGALEGGGERDDGGDYTPEGEEPDWAAVLMNKVGNLGRELCGAEARLDTLVEGTTEYDAAALIIDNCRAAVAIKIDKARTVEVPTLIKNCNKLTLNGISIPKVLQQIYTMRVVNSDVHAGILSSAPLAVAQTWARRCSLSDSEPLFDWDVEDPMMNSCKPVSEEEAVETEFRKTYHQAVFNDGFVTAFKQGCQGGPGPQLIIIMSRELLEELCTYEEVATPCMARVLAPVFKVCRGVIAAAWAMPLAYGARLEDVLYVFPDRRVTPMVKDIEKVGKLIASLGSLEGGPWLERKQLYKDFTGAEAINGPDVWTFYLKVRCVQPPVELNVVEPLLGTYLENQARWKAKGALRPLAVLPVEELLANFMDTLFAQSEELNPAAIRQWESGLKVMDAQSAKKLHNSLLVKIKHVAQEEAVASFDMILTAFQVKPALQDVESVLNTIRAAAAQSQAFNPSQVKLLETCGRSLINVLFQMAAPPRRDEVVSPLLLAAPLLLEIKKFSTSDTKPLFEETANLFSHLNSTFETHELMMSSEDYEGKRPLLDKHVRNLETMAGHVTQGTAGQLNKHVKDSSFLEVLIKQLATFRLDLTKAGEVIGARIDAGFLEKVKQMESIAGGGRDSASWWGEMKPGKTIEEHFSATLEKVNVQPICDKYLMLTECIQAYAISRDESAEKDTLLARGGEALLRARVTQLECLIMKNVKKSRNPKARIETAMSNFDTEDHTVSRRINAAECLGPPVSEFLRTTYGLCQPVPAVAAEAS